MSDSMHEENEIISEYGVVEAGNSYEIQIMGYNNQPLTFFGTEQINGQLTKRYKGLYDICRDIQEAIEAVSKIISLEVNTDSVIKRALLSHAIILYGRCFSEAEGRSVKLDAKKPWITDEGDERKRHIELIEFRNKLFAHAGDHYLYKVDSLVVVDNPQNPQTIQLFPCRFDLQGFGNEDLEKTKKHFEKVQERVIGKFNEITQSLGKQCYEAITGNKWKP